MNQPEFERIAVGGFRATYVAMAPSQALTDETDPESDPDPTAPFMYALALTLIGRGGSKRSEVLSLGRQDMDRLVADYGRVRGLIDAIKARN